MDDNRYGKLTPAERQEEYLQLLREKNRIKKQMKAKSRKEEEIADRERGFVTHFAGANATEKVKKQKVVSIASKIKVEDISGPKPDKGRKRWSLDNNKPEAITPGEHGGLKIPHGEWKKRTNSAGDSINPRRWSEGSGGSSGARGDNEDRRKRFNSSDISDQGEINEVSDDEASENEYEEDFEEDFEDGIDTDPAQYSEGKYSEIPPQVMRKTAPDTVLASQNGAVKPDVLQMSMSSPRPENPRPLYASNVTAAQHGSKIRTEKEVIRLQSSGRPQSSMGISPSLSESDWKVDNNFPERPVSNQSGLRKSGVVSHVENDSSLRFPSYNSKGLSETKPEMLENVLVPSGPYERSPIKRPTSKSKHVRGTTTSDEEKEFGQNANNVSNALDESLLGRVTELDIKQREKLLNILRGLDDTSGTPSSETYKRSTKIDSQSPKRKNSTGRSFADSNSPRVLSLSQMTTLPVHKQESVPGSLAIASANAQAKFNAEVSIASDNPFSESGMSELFRTPLAPFNQTNDTAAVLAGPPLGTSFKSSTVNELSESPQSVGATCSIDINCRIRIHNGWMDDKSKKRFVTLRHIDLRLVGSTENIDMSALQTSLFCGLTPLSKASDSVASMKKLFSAGLSTTVSSMKKEEEWKGPYDIGNPLEIRITGTLQIDKRKCEEALIASGLPTTANESTVNSDILELVISNGTVLPARDADVYVGQKCVWSGCFDQLLNENSDAKYRPDAASLASAKLIIPLRQKIRGTTNKARSELLTPITELSSSGTSDLGVTKASVATDRSTSIKNTDAPSWLPAKVVSDSNLAVEYKEKPVSKETNDILRKSVKSIRKVDDLIFDPPHEVKVNVFDDVLGPMPRLDSAAPASSHSRSRRQKKKEDDEALRQSLDALEQSNRLNRGRLRGGRRAHLGDAEAINDTEEPMEDSLNTESLAIKPNIILSKKDLSVKEIEALNLEAGARGETERLNAKSSMFDEAVAVMGTQDPAIQKQGQDRLLRKRSEKIDKVQESVRSALANLAGVMSNLSVAQVPKIARGRDEVDSTDFTSGIRVSPLTIVSSQDDKRVKVFSVSEKDNLARKKGQDEFQLVSEPDLLDSVAMFVPPDIANELDPLESSIGAIPVLPSGSVLRVEIVSTWGDQYYVGLNGIDVFDDRGLVVAKEASATVKHNKGKTPKNNVPKSDIMFESICGNPSDINVLDEYENDPRHVTNLIETTNFTRDDMHVWLAPTDSMAFEMEYDTSGSAKNKDKNARTYITDALGKKYPLIATVTLQFSSKIAISMIRIWNYNKSRTHSSRGVRRCRLLLDNSVIFDGEIRQAPGTLESVEECCEVILFSHDLRILANIASHDDIAGYNAGSKVKDVDEAAKRWIDDMNRKKQLRRPRTADTTAGDDALNLTSSTIRTGTELVRPTTSAVGAAKIRDLSESAEFMISLKDQMMFSDNKVDSGLVRMSAAAQNEFFRKEDEKTSGFQSKKNGTSDNGLGNKTSVGSMLSGKDLISASVITLTIESTWGDPSYVGLNGLEVLLGSTCEPADINEKHIDADPRDLSVIGCFDDVRTLDKLIDGFHETTDEKHMWLIPFSKGSCHRITIDLQGESEIGGLRIWNYNKSPEDVLRGARVITVWLDNKSVGSFVARIAPGCDGVNFGQTVFLKDLAKYISPPSRRNALAYITPAVRQSYETPLLPRGMQWKFSIYSNWGDSYYVGLDAIEFLDENGVVYNVSPMVAPNNKSFALQSSMGKGATGTSALLTAVPYSVGDLAKDGESSAWDQRTPSNLFNGVNRDSSGHNAWLAPLAHCMASTEREKRGYDVLHAQPGARGVDAQKLEQEFVYFDENVLYVMFDYPITVSAIRLYNYSKNPTRGVRDFSIDVDGTLLYMGTIEAALDEAKYVNLIPDGANTRGACSVIFTNDSKFLTFEKEKVQYCGNSDQDVLHIDERKVMVRSKAMFEKPSPTTEGIYTDPQNRPTTSLVRS